MKLFASLEPFFRALSDGKLIRLTAAWVLRVLAVLMALVGLFWFIFFLRLGFNASENGLGGRAAGLLIGCFLFALFGLVWGYLAAGILTFRARSVSELGDSHFTVLSILSLLFRLNGEMAFVTYSVLGVGGCLFVWFTNFSPLSELGMLSERLPFAESSSSGFLGGIEFVLLMLLIAFAAIVFFYALAELTVVWVEIALNTRGLRAAPGSGQVSVPRPARPALLEQPGPGRKQCRQCGQVLDAGATFCDECGSPIA
jgi:hypothetical protein